MLPDNAFLRTIPNILDPTEAVHIDALVFSGDTILASISAIRHVALHFKERILDAGRYVKVGMFTHAWTIVDCVHVIRQNICALKYETDRSARFLQKYEAAKLLRDKMDHLAQNAQNIARTKRRPPIFGSLAYACIPDDKIVKDDEQTRIAGGGMVVLTTGRVDDMKRLEAVNPAGLELNGQVGGFRLDAFNQQLELEAAAQDAQALLLEMDQNIRRQIHELVEAKAVEFGVSKEELLKHSGAGLSFYIAFSAADE